MKPRDIFGLAVRLLGLCFLYLGLRAVMPMLDVEAIKNADKVEIINAILPIVFNFAVAWWLLGGGLLMWRAYPETPKISGRSHAERETPVIHSPPAQEVPDMDSAEKKLAALVKEPKITTKSGIPSN
jgi:hypothetical protein